LVALAALREVAVGPLALADLVFVVLQALQEALERLAARTKLLLSSLGLFAATKDRSGDSGADHSTDDLKKIIINFTATINYDKCVFNILGII
jgi:hypothetical protein